MLTSGRGEIYPSGLIVGTIEEIHTDPSGMTRYAVIQPRAELEQLTQVFVIKEFDIVELLSMHPSQVFDRERIYEAVWGYDAPGDSSVVPEHIRRLRRQLLQAGCSPRIETVWGVGYKWAK